MRVVIDPARAADIKAELARLGPPDGGRITERRLVLLGEQVQLSLERCDAAAAALEARRMRHWSVRLGRLAARLLRLGRPQP